MAPIAQGDTVRVHYTGKLEDGTKFDSSEGRDPVQFVAGGDELIPGVSQAVIGMETGDKKTVTVAPEEGYGHHDESKKIRVKRNEIPAEAQVGSVLGMQVQEETYHVQLVELGDDYAVLDGNHPLAGKTLTFELEIVGCGD